MDVFGVMEVFPLGAETTKLIDSKDKEHTLTLILVVYLMETGIKTL